MRDDNVELVAARRAGATMLSRGQVLAELATARPVVGLTGTHGKTTATSMMVHVLAADGRDAGRLLGADVLGVGANGHWGSGDVVVEVDESYGDVRAGASARARDCSTSRPITSITTARSEPSRPPSPSCSTAPTGPWSSGATTRAVGASRPSRIEACCASVPATSAWRVHDVALTRDESRFTLSGPASELDVVLHVTGVHNVADAAVVAVLACELGVSADAVARGLAQLPRGAATIRTLGVVARRRRLRELRAPAGRDPRDPCGDARRRVTSESPRSSNRIA